jgi:hypothetical protein
MKHVVPCVSIPYCLDFRLAFQLLMEADGTSFPVCSCGLFTSSHTKLKTDDGDVYRSGSITLLFLLTDHHIPPHALVLV